MRIDGSHAIPWLPPYLATCYPASYTHAGFLLIQPGDSDAAVRARLGAPFAITWYDDIVQGPSITFEPTDRGWVATSSHNVVVPPRASMASLEAQRSLPNEYWSYSRKCTSSESQRVRGLTLRGGRVVRRDSAVIYD
jgi:hypothetical protein